jgi:hypothetical protein
MFTGPEFSCKCDHIRNRCRPVLLFSTLLQVLHCSGSLKYNCPPPGFLETEQCFTYLSVFNEGHTSKLIKAGNNEDAFREERAHILTKK